MGARVGRHVAGRLVGGGPTGIVGPWLGIRDGSALALNCPLFICVISYSFLHVGLFSHMVLPFAGDVDAWRASDSIRTAEIAWTRVHAIIKSSMCSIGGVSKDDERLTYGHVASREAPDLHQNKGHAIAI